MFGVTVQNGFDDPSLIDAGFFCEGDFDDAADVSSLAREEFGDRIQAPDRCIEYIGIPIMKDGFPIVLIAAAAGKVAEALVFVKSVLDRWEARKRTRA